MIYINMNWLYICIAIQITLLDDFARNTKQDIFNLSYPSSRDWQGLRDPYLLHVRRFGILCLLRLEIFQDLGHLRVPLKIIISSLIQNRYRPIRHYFSVKAALPTRVKWMNCVCGAWMGRSPAVARGQRGDGGLGGRPEQLVGFLKIFI